VLSACFGKTEFLIEYMKVELGFVDSDLGLVNLAL